MQLKPSFNNNQLFEMKLGGALKMMEHQLSALIDVFGHSWRLKLLLFCEFAIKRILNKSKTYECINKANLNP